MPRVRNARERQAERRRQQGFVDSFNQTTGQAVALQPAQLARESERQRAAQTRGTQTRGTQTRGTQTQGTQTQGTQRDARLQGHPENARFVSSDGRVSYNERGQRLDSTGNVARQTGRSRRQSQPSAASERTTGLSPTGVTEGAPALQLPWLALQQAATGAPALGGAGGPVAPDGFPTPGGGQFAGAPPDPNQFATLGLPGPGANPLPWQGLTAQQQQAALNYYNTVLPWAQFNQNAFTDARDFAETARRFGLEFAQRQREAAFANAGRAQLPNVRFIGG